MTVFVRPERITPALDADARTSTGVFSGVVAADRYLGPIRRIDLNVQGGLIRLETHLREAVTSVQVPPDAVRLLPPTEFQQKGTTMNRRQFMTTMAAGAIVLSFASSALAFEGPELYQGEKALYEAAQKEGLVVSFDTGPTWANWAGQFKAFQKRYPGVEMVYNDLGSAATVVALDKSRNRPQADTAYYFAASALDAAKAGVVEGYKPTNFDRLPETLRATDGQWFTVHTLSVAFLVNTKLVKNVPKTWADLLKPEYKNAIVYQDPRSTGQGQVVTFAASFGNGGSMDDVTPGIDYLGKLSKAGNVLRTVGTTPYAQFLKG